jgi:RimJ/RimL family protein N-acetyltransferase
VRLRLHPDQRNPLRRLSVRDRLSRVDVRLETARLVLRRFTEADVDDIAALLAEPAVMRYIEGRPIPRTEVEEQTLPEILRQYRELPRGMGLFAAVDKATGTFIGWFSLRPAHSHGLDGGTEIGYRVLPAHWGRGLATEGARALVDSAFRDLGADRVVATTMTVNAGSRRVLEKAGLRFVRTFFLDWPEYLEGAEHGDVEYALTRAEWAAEEQAAG